MANASYRAQAFDSALREFTNSPLDSRVEIATGLLAVGADEAEGPFQRNFALSILATIIGVCELRNNEQMQEELVDIIDSQGRPKDYCPNEEGNNPGLVASRQVQKGALLALTAVNRSVGLKRFDRLIKEHAESNYGRELIVLRNAISKRD